MTDANCIALIHAEIDGELDGRQRAELARLLLADPAARALREDLMRLRSALDSVGEVEPPAQLRDNILGALPVPTTPTRRSAWRTHGWRYAALVAGVLVAAAVVLETVDGPGPGSREIAGTIAAPRLPVTLDTVRLESGPVAGQVRLYRDGEGLAVGFDVQASAPVDVLIASGGHTLRVNGIGREVGAGRQETVVDLRGSGMSGGQALNLTFLMSGREVGHATLMAPKGQ